MGFLSKSIASKGLEPAPPEGLQRAFVAQWVEGLQYEAKYYPAPVLPSGDDPTHVSPSFRAEILFQFLDFAPMYLRGCRKLSVVTTMKVAAELGRFLHGNPNVSRETYVDLALVAGYRAILAMNGYIGKIKQQPLIRHMMYHFGYGPRSASILDDKWTETLSLYEEGPHACSEFTILSWMHLFRSSLAMSYSDAVVTTRKIENLVLVTLLDGRLANHQPSRAAAAVLAHATTKKAAVKASGWSFHDFKEPFEQLESLVPIADQSNGDSLRTFLNVCSSNKWTYGELDFVFVLKESEDGKKQLMTDPK